MLLPKDSNGCPFLILAPMEGVGDSLFRKAIATIGGFDEAVRDFIRIPSNAHVKSLTSVYDKEELSPVKFSPQLMGSDPELMAEAAIELEKRGASRIDLNCGCPSNTVTGRGAGSSLLKEPNFLHEIAKAMVKAVKIPVTIKMRIGFSDESLFLENLKAAEESGAAFITLHPRTKVDGYGPPAKWEFIALAKSTLKIPLVGNGDILTVENALKMLSETHCDALMIGRGSLINPFIFHEIRSHFSKKPFHKPFQDLKTYLETYFQEMNGLTPRLKVNKLKQILSFLFKGSPTLLQKRDSILRCTSQDPEFILRFALEELHASW